MRKASLLRNATVVVVAVFAAVELAACGSADETYPKRSSAGVHETAAEKHVAPVKDHGVEETLKLSGEERRTAGIVLETVRTQALTGSISMTATIRANQDRIAHVAPRVGGRIVAVAANLGDRVVAGQTLATLDSLEVGEAHSAYLQAVATYRVARNDLKRTEALNADEIIPLKEFVRANGEYEKASAALRAAESKPRMLGVAVGATPGLAGAGRAVSTFPLVAPLAGTVIEKHAILGELGRNDQTMFTIADLSRLWIEANLTEVDLARVRAGIPAAVTVAAYPNERFAGRVTYVANVLHKETRTVPTRIEVDNRDGRLKLEMFATAYIEVEGSKHEALAVPDDAIVLVQGQPTVFVEESGGFVARTVEPGERLAGRTVLKSGLAAGDKVVTGGAYALKARMLKSQLGEGHAH